MNILENRKWRCQQAVEKGYKYNPDTGELTGLRGWIINKYDNHGYIKLQFTVNNKKYNLLGHQLAWYIVYGEVVNCLDHINGDKTNNRIDNLRSVTFSENQWNNRASGVTWVERLQKWLAQIGVNGKVMSLGCFTLEADARQAYLDAKKIYHVIGNK